MSGAEQRPTDLPERADEPSDSEARDCELSDSEARDCELSDCELSDSERRWLDEDLRRRRRARALAVELSLDESEVYHQIKQLERDPIERLRRGLAHGRRRPRLPDER